MSQFIDQYFDISFMSKHFDQVLSGFGKTMLLWAVASVIALIWGLILSLLRQTPGKAGLIVRVPTIIYIDAFRGIPLLLVILLIYGGFGALSATNATPGPLPEWLAIPTWFGQPAAFWYGAMALVITYGAYMAEVYRAGIESVPEGQTEAARSLGMSHAQTMRYVIVPQAVRRVIPPLLNDLIALMKDTSLVFAISLVEVVQVGYDLQSKTFNSSALTLGAIMFLIVTLPLARLVDWLIARDQRKMRRGGETPGGMAAPAAAAGSGLAGGPT
jgi:polar amino acid transport system permease protein